MPSGGASPGDSGAAGEPSEHAGGSGASGAPPTGESGSGAAGVPERDGNSRAGASGAGGASGICEQCRDDGYLCQTSTCVADPSAPGAPTIDGESSAGHPDLLWVWDSVAGATHYEVSLDGAAWHDVAEALRYSATVDVGLHTVRVRACSDACSLPTGFETRVEYPGRNSGPWLGLARGLPESPMGREVAVSCNDCYRAVDGAILTDEEARSKVDLALSRGADLIELDACWSDSELCVSREDVDDCSDRASLDGIGHSDSLTTSDAALSVEITEADADPTEFAAHLLGFFDVHRALVQNGRPLHVRASESRLPYLLAVADALPAYPFISTYVRLGVVYERTTYAAVGDMQNAVRDDVLGNGLDWVEFDHTTPNLLALVGFSRSLGLGVGLRTIPAVDGAAHITRLREEADALSTEYRVDLARDALVARNLLARVDARLCESPADETVEVFRNDPHNDGALTSETIPLDVTPTADAVGSPPMRDAPAGGDQYGCYFRFTEATDPARVLDLGVTTATRGGYWVSAALNFDNLALAEGELMTIVSNAEAAGFSLELVGRTSGTVLRFCAHVSGDYRCREHTVYVGSGQAGVVDSPIGALNGTDSYHVVGAYAEGTLKLWINGQGIDEGDAYTDAVRLSPVHALVGANPQVATQESPGLPINYFLGMIQEATVVDWGPVPSGEAN